MAVNIFKNVTANLTTSGDALYTSPLGYTGIILLAQISNLTANTISASVFVQTDSSLTSLATGFQIPANDAGVVIGGKLVLEAGQQLFASASANSAAQITLSILESQN